MKEKNTHRLNEYRILNDARTDKFISELEFELTDAQKKTWEEIKENMSGSALMSRLIQGDVGSGKTIIAVLALMNLSLIHILAFQWDTITTESCVHQNCY